MQINNFLQMNDWEIKKFLEVVLAIQLAMWGVIGLHKAALSSRPVFFKINCIKIQNHYYLVKKYKFSKVAFWWSTFGSLLAHIIIFLIIQPYKKNRLALTRIIDGIMKTMSKLYKDSQLYNF